MSGRAALLLFASLALMPAGARADDGGDAADQALKANQELLDRFHGDQRAVFQYLKTHREVEPWLGIPADQGSQQLYDKTFGKGTFQVSHVEAHYLLMNYAGDKKMPPAEQKQGIAKILQGVGQAVSNGLEYAGIKAAHLPKDQEDAALSKIDEKMDATGELLASIPTNSPFGKNAEAAMLAGESRFHHPGIMQVVTTVQGWDKAKQIIANNPANPGLNVSAGNAALSSGDAAAAKKYYDDALSIDPGNSDALSGRAAANMDLKNYPAAIQDANDALRIDPEDAGAKAVLQLAHDAVAGGVAIDKNNPFKQQANTDGATAAGASMGSAGTRSLAPSNGAGLQSSAFTREGFRLLEVGDDQAAVKNASKAISLDPKNSDAYGVRAFALAHGGDYQGALKDAVAALALDPSNTMAHNARAKALNQMGMYHEALAAADDAIRANPRNAYAYYMKAMALNGLGERKNMIAALGQAAALDPRFQDAFDLAKSAPDEKDLGFLFPEDQLAAARAALRNQPAGPKRYFWGLTMPTIAGAALLLFGLLHFVFTWALPRLRGGYQAAVRTGPSLGAGTIAAPLPTPPPFATGRHAPAGTVLRGQYRRLGQIGSSVHGAVYEGMDQALERRVVIRKLRADMRASDRERLLAPARAAAGLAHAGISPVYAVFEEGEALYLVSEFAPGRSLRDWLAARGPLTWEEALPLFRQVAAAVDYAHGKGIVHGAVKASNIMISSEGHAKIVDYGLSRGPLDKSADLQSLAACLREAIAGLPPHRLDAVDAALTKARDAIATANQVVDVVEAGLASAA